jgi:hypothetical protein
MSEDTPLQFDLPSVARKTVSEALDGGMLSSNGGVLLLRGVERRLGLAVRLAGCVGDGRNPESIGSVQNLSHFWCGGRSD